MSGFYRKNIGGPQQIVRIVIGVAAAIAAYFWLAPPLGLVGIAAGLMFAATGFVGYCPACAAMGINTRK